MSIFGRKTPHNLLDYNTLPIRCQFAASRWYNVVGFNGFLREKLGIKAKKAWKLFLEYTFNVVIRKEKIDSDTLTLDEIYDKYVFSFFFV